LKHCEQVDDPAARVQAHYGHGVTLYDLGELAEAERHLETALAQYDPETHATHVGVYGGYDPGVACHSWLGWIHFMRGEPDRAIRVAEEGVALAERLPHRFSLTFAHLALAILHLHRGEVALARPYLARATAIAREDGFAYHLAILAGLEGWAALLEGRPEDAIAHIEESLEGHAATGAGLGLPSLLSVAAYAKAFVGRAGEGLEDLEVAIASAEETSQCLHLGPLYRARGELLLLLGEAESRSQAENWYERARQLARLQGARMNELQAALGSARLLREGGRAEEARALVASTYAEFREGFSTRLLREAKGFLDEIPD
jgi:adenylate cyclase